MVDILDRPQVDANERALRKARRFVRYVGRRAADSFLWRRLVALRAVAAGQRERDQKASTGRCACFQKAAPRNRE